MTAILTAVILLLALATPAPAQMTWGWVSEGDVAHQKFNAKRGKFRRLHEAFSVMRPSQEQCEALREGIETYDTVVAPLAGLTGGRARTLPCYPAVLVNLERFLELEWYAEQYARAAQTGMCTMDAPTEPDAGWPSWFDSQGWR